MTLGFFDLFGFCNQEMKWADWSPSWPQCHRQQLEEYLSVTESFTHSLGCSFCHWMLHSPTPHPRAGFMCCFQDVSDYCHFSGPLVAVISVQTIGNSFMKWNFKMCSPAGVPRDSSMEAFPSVLALFLPLLSVVIWVICSQRDYLLADIQVVLTDI